MRPRHAPAATWVLAAAAVIGACPRAVAQSPPPSPADTMASYHTVSSWLADGAPPDEPQSGDPQGLAAACVTLRLDGRVVGRGLAFAGDGKDLWRAASDAAAAAAESLPDGTEPSLDRSRLALDIELAGEPIPLVGESDTDLLAQINPGIDGIAVRAGQRVGYTFPAQMLSSGWTPAQGLMHAVAPLDLPPLDFQSLRNRYGLVVYRFPAEHLAQPRAGAEPIFLRRGTRTISLAELSGARLLNAADEAASFLMRLEWPGPEAHGIRGDYDPIAGAFDDAVAPPASQSIAAWALVVYASTPGADHDNASHALRVARRIISDFARVTEWESSPADDPGALALWLVALRHAGGVESFSPEESEPIAAYARDAYAHLMAATAAPDDRDRIPPAQRSIITLALAGSEHDDLAPVGTRERARELARWLYVETDQGDLVSLMPWLGLASIELADEKAIPSQAALREMRSLIWRFSVPAVGTDPSVADLIGGVVFTRGRTPLPSWQSLRPLAFLAVMAGDPRLTDASERSEAWMRLTESLRFAVQLQVGEACGHMLVRPELARGGVRLAPWDQKCSVAATSLALVSFCEATRSALSAADPAKPPAP